MVFQLGFFIKKEPFITLLARIPGKHARDTESRPSGLITLIRFKSVRIQHDQCTILDHLNATFVEC